MYYAKLLKELEALFGVPVWRDGEDGRRMMLTISAAGLEAIGVEPDAEAAHPSATAKAKPKRRRATKNRKPGKRKNPVSKSTAPRRSKQDTIIGLLQKDDGATIADLQAATGWQPHSVRAALTGLRKKGYDLDRSTAADNVSRYRITGGPEDRQ